MEYGVSEADARERAVDAMGDAGEIGRQWNEQFSPFWLWLGRLCKAGCILLVLCMIWPLFIQIGNIYENLSARSYAKADPNLSGEKVLWQQELDIREEFGDHVIRIFGAAVTEHHKEPEMGRLRVYITSYSRNPLHPPLDHNILDNISCNGERSWGSSGDRINGYAYKTVYFDIEMGMETAEITLDHCNRQFSVEIPLEWGGDGL